MAPLSERFAALATRYSFGKDAFQRARLQLAFLFFLTGVATFVVVDLVIDPLIRSSLYEVALNQTGQPVEEAFQELKVQLWVGRAIKLLVMAFLGYFLAAYAMRHIRQSIDRQARFVATVSHQMRTPLAVIRTSNEVLLKKKNTITKEQALTAIEDNLTQVTRLSDSIEFLLSFSSLEKQRSLAKEQVNLTTIVDQVVALLTKDELYQNRLHVAHGGSATMVGNAIALRELVLNLTKNALKYSNDDSPVTIRTQRDGRSRLTLIIEDSGPGIASEDLPHIFEPFFRGPSAEQTGKVGVGLGLSLVKEIATLHGAFIDVQTSSRGTAFHIVFPN